MTPAIDSTAPWWTQNATGVGYFAADAKTKLDLSRNAADTYLVESWGYSHFPACRLNLLFKLLVDVDIKMFIVWCTTKLSGGDNEGLPRRCSS